MGDVNYSGQNRPIKNYKLDKKGTLGHSGPFVGEVMNTVDPARMGRIQVWIKTFGDENTKYDPSTWFTVRYLSPFYGVTSHKSLDDAPPADFETNGHAYGMWMNAPDVGVEVLVMFAEADPNQGYYIGYIPTPQLNHMIPAIGAQANPHYNNSSQQEKCVKAASVPVTEIDQSTKSMKDSSFADIQKPVHSVVASQLWKQGLLADTVRGPITSSVQRESPTYVFGVSTPGRPIYRSGLFDHEVKQKVESGEVTDTSIVGRRGGHTFVLDDGDINGNNSLIRIRTASGHQFTLSDDGNSIFLIHANGNSWVELGVEGTVDVYAANSINLRSGGEINLHADTNVNINALQNVNMYSKSNITLEAEKELNLTGKSNVIAYSKTTVGIKSDGTLALDSSGLQTFKSSANINIKGSQIHLNDTSAKSLSAPKALNQINHDDSVMDNTEGWKSVSNKFKSIASRAPTHEPYSGHGAGVSNVKGPGSS